MRTEELCKFAGGKVAGYVECYAADTQRKCTGRQSDWYGVHRAMLITHCCVTSNPTYFCVGYDIKGWTSLRQKAFAVMGNCSFYAGLSHWVTVLGCEMRCQQQATDFKCKEDALAKAEKKIRGMELEIQKLKEDQEPRKRAKK